MDKKNLYSTNRITNKNRKFSNFEKDNQLENLEILRKTKELELNYIIEMRNKANQSYKNVF